jgi:hypothetical protein
MKAVVHVDDAVGGLQWTRLKLLDAEPGGRSHNRVVELVVEGVWAGLEMLMW